MKLIAIIIDQIVVKGSVHFLAIDSMNTYEQIYTTFNCNILLQLTPGDGVDTPIDITPIGHNADSYEIDRPILSTILHTTAMP